MDKALRALAGALPETLTAFSSLAGGSVTRSGIGVLYAVPLGGIAAGAAVTIAHNLQRVPNRCQVLDNPGAYKGDCFFVSKTTSSCVVQVSNALAAGAVLRIS